MDRRFCEAIELVDQPVLQRPEHPFRAPSGLRRISADMLDPELLERPANLGQAIAIDLAAGLGGEKVMAAAVGVEAHRQAVLRENLVERPEGRGRSLLLDQEGRIDRPRRVVERHNEIERRLALEPGVA
jgi:hypothetical protein